MAFRAFILIFFSLECSWLNSPRPSFQLRYNQGFSLALQNRMKHHKQQRWLGSYMQNETFGNPIMSLLSHFSFLLSARNKNSNARHQCLLIILCFFGYYSLCYASPILVYGQLILIVHHSCNVKASFHDDWWENDNANPPPVSLRKEALIVSKPLEKVVCPNGFWAQYSAVKHTE